MTSPLARPNDRRVYEKILADLRGTGLPQTAAEAIWKTYPQVMPQTTLFGWFPPSEERPEVLTGLVAKDGDSVLYWNGRRMKVAIFDQATYWQLDHIELSRRVQKLAEHLRIDAPVVLDLGAGTCPFSCALRSIGCNFGVIHVEADRFALEAGNRILRAASLEDVAILHSDINLMLSAPETRCGLRDIIRDLAGDRPIVVYTRSSIHGFYTPGEYARLFSFLIDDLSAVAGVHLELSGTNTGTFQKLLGLLPSNIDIAAVFKDAPGDPLIYLEALEAVRVHERIEIWPHYLNGRFPSYLSWTRR